MDIQQEYDDLAMRVMGKAIGRVRMIFDGLIDIRIAAMTGAISSAEAVEQFENVEPGCLAAVYDSMFAEANPKPASHLSEAA
jgi:hypothetical protein